MSNFYVFANNGRYTRGGVETDLCASDFHYTVRTDELPWEDPVEPSAGLDYAGVAYGDAQRGAVGLGVGAGRFCAWADLSGGGAHQGEPAAGTLPSATTGSVATAICSPRMRN